MIVARSVKEVPLESASIVTVGTFDGVHRGHRAILTRVLEAAKQKRAQSMVLTFEPHPRVVLGARGEKVEVLTSVEERAGLFAAAGIDVMVVIPFTLEFSRQSAEEFVRRWLVDSMHVHHMVVGHDHHFGKGRQGGVEELARLGKEWGFSVEQVPPLVIDGSIVSSSLIRSALREGEIDRAAAFLGYRYNFNGVVVRGDRRGETLGYPTANLRLLPPEKMIPGHGVYVVEGRWDGGRRYGMMNIGVRPTVGSGLQETTEVHFFDYQGEMYSKEVRVELLARLREERKFPSLDALVRQLNDDRQESHRIIKRLAEISS
ncbi:MAG: bifunctional riboflavin kinase/FAD synthetase [Bacteroidota bacterium]